MIPAWLEALSIAMLVLGGICASIIAVDEWRHPQNMAIMNLVWPVTALFGSVWIVWQYFAYGRPVGNDGRRTPFPMMVADGTLHCGAGCTLGDICAEWLVFAVPAILVAFGWGWLFSERMFAAWIVDYLFAYAFGIVFQYFTIAPMRGLSLGAGLIAAVKADTLSLTAWQIGMYGFMAVAEFLIFRRGFGSSMSTDTPVFWFMMQISMICGFATAYPVNWYLLRIGLKEAM